MKSFELIIFFVLLLVILTTAPLSAQAATKINLAHPLITTSLNQLVTGTIDYVTGVFSFQFNTQKCPGGQVLTGVGSDGKITCAPAFITGNNYGKTNEHIQYTCTGSYAGGQCYAIDRADCLSQSPNCSWVPRYSCPGTTVRYNPTWPGSCKAPAGWSSLVSCASGFTLKLDSSTCVSDQPCYSYYSCKKN